MNIPLARKTMWKAFEKYPDFANVYKVQIACFIMDNFKGFEKNTEKRDKLAEQLFNILYKE